MVMFAEILIAVSLSLLGAWLLVLLNDIVNYLKNKFRSR